MIKGSSTKTKQYWKQKIKQQMQRKMYKKQIFGDKYNFESVKINNNKKYFNDQIKNLQIQRSNRLLLEKIKRIADRSRPRNIIQRARTQVIENQQALQRSQTQNKLYKKKQIQSVRRNRYESVASILEKTRVKTMDRTRQQNQSQLTIKQQGDKQTYKTVLFRGKKLIDGVLFSFTIYIQNQLYKIVSQTNTTSQNMQIPLQNYKYLLKQQLQNQHKNIFKLLRLTQHKKLQLIGSKKYQIDLIQKAEISLPIKKSIPKDI